MATLINLDNAKRVDITCRKGDTFQLDLTFTDDDGDAIDLSSYSWKMDVKETADASGDIIGDDSFTYAGTDEGKLKVSATAATMAGVTAGVYVYDLQSDNSGTIKTWIYGVFKINDDISE